MIGVVPAPLEWSQWEQVKAFLEPARAQGGFDSVIEPDEELFVVLAPSGELLAAATAWFDVERRFVEVKLVGGREHRRWLKDLNDFIGAAASEAGALSMVAFGRAGWRKALLALGWASDGERDGITAYSRKLGE